MNKAEMAAMLRHAYEQLRIPGAVKDQEGFADGLIAPVIRSLENWKAESSDLAHARRLLDLWDQYANLRHDWMGAGQAAGEWLESLGLVVDIGGEVELTEAGRKLLGRK